MWTTPHWIDAGLSGRLGIAPRPRGGDWLRDEIQAWRREGISLVICLLEPAEMQELELADESAFCREADIEFLSLPIADRGVPDPESARTTIESAYARIQKGHAVVVHCRAGIGRSSLVAGSILILAGNSTDQAIELIRAARGVIVPDTEAQLEWLRRFEVRCRAER